MNDDGDMAFKEGVVNIWTYKGTMELRPNEGYVEDHALRSVDFSDLVVKFGV